MSAEYAPPDWRLPGCDQRCELRTVIAPGLLRRANEPVHDPDAHELYGARRAGGPDWDIVRTGPLEVSLSAGTARVLGREIVMTGREWLVFAFVVEARGGYRTTQDVGRALWPDDERVVKTSMHAARVWLTRIRKKLGDAWPLMQTTIGRGVRLQMLPPGPYMPAAPSAERWARNWDCCQRCHTTERPHVGSGWCGPCRWVMRPNPKRPRTSNGRYLTPAQRDGLEPS